MKKLVETMVGLGAASYGAVKKSTKGYKSAVVKEIIDQFLIVMNLRAYTFSEYQHNNDVRMEVHSTIGNRLVHIFPDYGGPTPSPVVYVDKVLHELSLKLIKQYKSEQGVCDHFEKEGYTIPDGVRKDVLRAVFPETKGLFEVQEMDFSNTEWDS